MLNTENLAIYLIFSLIIGIALFTVVGAISMMFLDKKVQLNILLAMGLVPRQVQQVFFLLGGMLSWVGGSIGIILAALLVGIQQHWPFLYIPEHGFPIRSSFKEKSFACNADHLWSRHTHLVLVDPRAGTKSSASGKDVIAPMRSNF